MSREKKNMVTKNTALKFWFGSLVIDNDNINFHVFTKSTVEDY